MLKAYIQSLRLRTLPLSMAGVLLGTGLAWSSQWSAISGRQIIVFVLALLTAVSLQILSNLSNELGDSQKGTDTDQQGRVAYGLQAGTITEKQMRGMIRFFLGLCVLLGTFLINTAFDTLFCLESIIFFGLGLLAIIGAMTYTLGKHSYGYMGLGDLGVFLFFGLLSTLGGYYLQTQTLSWEVCWCGVAIGLPCVGVLNLNNIRDMSNDLAHGKRTFAGLLGPLGGRIYHTCLIVGCLTIFTLYGHWWCLCILPIWLWHLWYVWTHKENLDRQMPVLMLTTLVVALLALFG